jgi:predicted lipoprotein with Yx(FWY)xxD motif
MSRERRIRLLAPVVLLAAIGGVLAATQAQAISWWPWGKSSQAQSNTVLSTPPGITLQAVGRGQGWDLGKETASMVYRDEVAFADAKGKTLYFREAGASPCKQDCDPRFKAVQPSKNSQPIGDWTIVRGDDGSSQWAWKGRLVYTFAEDADPGSVFGNSAARFGAKRRDGFGNMVGGGRRGSGVRGAGGEKPKLEGWETALVQPMRGDFITPPGLKVAEVLDAASITLVDHRGMTVYVHEGDKEPPLLEGDLASGKRRLPVPAPAVAVAIGDFSVVSREDGRSQWAWKDRPLYTYSGDNRSGDAYGVGGAWSVAAIYSHFMPAGVRTELTASQGLVLATQAGKTLYKRDGHIYQSGGGRSLHRGAPQRPAVGRDLGVNARCLRDCEKWTPFLAPDDAVARGYWDVYVRADGKKQWAYQGYALWTFADDKQPGDMFGHDSYDMFYAMNPQSKVDVGTPMDGVATLVWAVAFP